MKKITAFLFSAELMAVILIVFALSVGIATFIENDFGSSSARVLVYNARWFELLLLMGAVNLTGRIVNRKLYRKETLTIFLFHIAFIVILAGAFLTRYTGWEGSVSIREGQSTNHVLTDKAYIQISKGSYSRNIRVTFDEFRKNRFDHKISLGDQSVEVKLKNFVPNAYKTIAPVDKGIPAAELIYADKTGRKSILVSEESNTEMTGYVFSFKENQKDSDTVVLTFHGDSLFFTAGFPVTLTGMGSQNFTILRPGETHLFDRGVLYKFKNQVVVLNRFLQDAKIAVQQLPQEQGKLPDAVVLEVSSGSEKKEIILSGTSGRTGEAQPVEINNTEIIFSYGSAQIEIPFELKLNDFIVERYPGSTSPSSFESRVVLTDTQRNITREQRIFMNNILKYRGFRFYQSSYDPDERGTILSVNHDLTGTTITYSGYILMALGMILSVFNKNSRFIKLSKRSKQIEKTHRSASLPSKLIIVLLMGSAICGTAQEVKPALPVKADHARLFGRMLVQDNDGRIEPLNTLSSQVLRKLYRSDRYKGMNADQVFLGMMSDPMTWQYEPLIRVSNKEIREMVGVDKKYFSFFDFFRDDRYVLEASVAEAFRKKPSLRSKTDNELIRLDEKINICYLVFSGGLLKIFPVPGDSSQTWYTYQSVKNKAITEDSTFTNHVLNLYEQEVQKSMQTGIWDTPEKILEAIYRYQQKYSAEIIPSSRSISAELLLNKSDIFSRISKFYGLVGFVLLLFQFVSLLFDRIKVKLPVALSTILIILIFSIHTVGLIVRWYVSGHAPLSNGYEALTYVAWATVLAGLVFSARSPVALSVTSVLSALILFVAHLSWMDPQITNLVPVLKSNWLVIHVATITASYGFLAMCALLGFLNLVLIVFISEVNKVRLGNLVAELTDTIELSMTIGLYLLTIGVFLGAVWANESWGRYWGWDPKETWALITVLVYAFIIHMRMIPGMRSCYSFNLASLLGFSTVIMTYFGVNYYLSGLHSYAKGDPLPVPSFVYYTLAVIAFVSIVSYFKRKQVKDFVD
ncbi:MAG TPA: cytochrome c biogenesis protein CcsA [Bacteroidales bacterium]|nr:cytochrome c biogenesis protein CcsA [Bacteroidales bacterium]